MSEVPPKIVTLGGQAFTPESQAPSEVQLVMDQVQEIINGNGAKAIAMCVILGDGSCTYAHHATEEVLSLLGATEQLKFKVHSHCLTGWDK